VEQSVRTALQRRVDQGEFIARGMASLDRAREANEYIGAGVRTHAVGRVGIC
jgi:hypothetical protein